MDLAREPDRPLADQRQVGHGVAAGHDRRWLRRLEADQRTIIRIFVFFSFLLSMLHSGKKMGWDRIESNHPPLASESASRRVAETRLSPISRLMPSTCRFCVARSSRISPASAAFPVGLS
jgi:hypothetical protein